MATTERALTLLGLFQSRAVWTAPELAGELGVTERTVRRDIDRLRELGYAIGADRGPAGGYRLRRGQVTPPLLLVDDEAVAVALALRVVGSSALLGDPEPALRALIKLEAMLPAAARARVARLGEAVRTIDLDGPRTDIEVLTTLADGVAQRVQVRLGYTDAKGEVTDRRVEPHRLVAWSRRWYLAAFDLDRDDWRTFRLDRITEVCATTFRFRPRPDEPDLSATLPRRGGASRNRVEVLVDTPIAELEHYSPYVTLEPVDERTTRLSRGTDDPEATARWLLMMPEPIQVVGDDAVIAAVRAMAGRAESMLTALRPYSR